MSHRLTKEEKAVIVRLDEALKEYLNLSRYHVPQVEDSEFCAAVYQAQRVVLARPAMRALNAIHPSPRSYSK